jgi:acetyl-CoA carboxylase biotin carboxylase subunit
MQRALSEFKVDGIKTTLPLFQKIMQHEVFQKGEAYTDFIAKYMSSTNGVKA